MKRKTVLICVAACLLLGAVGVAFAVTTTATTTPQSVAAPHVEPISASVDLPLAVGDMTPVSEHCNHCGASCIPHGARCCDPSTGHYCPAGYRCGHHHNCIANHHHHY